MDHDKYDGLIYTLQSFLEQLDFQPKTDKCITDEQAKTTKDKPSLKDISINQSSSSNENIEGETPKTDAKAEITEQPKSVSHTGEQKHDGQKDQPENKTNINANIESKSLPNLDTEQAKVIDKCGKKEKTRGKGARREKRKNIVCSSTRTESIKIECLECDGNAIFVGTNEGQLFKFNVGEVFYGVEKPSSVTLVNRVDLGCGKKKVEQIKLITEYKKLICLIDFRIIWYEYESMTRIHENMVDLMNGISCFSIDQITKYTRPKKKHDMGITMCVAKRKALEVYRIKESVTKEKELRLKYGAVAICHSGNYACMADIKGYKIIELEKNGKELDMFPIPEAYKDERTGKIVRPPRPKVEVVGPEEFMFVTITLIQNQGKEGEKEDERGQGQDQGQPSLGVIVTPSGEAQRTTLQFLETPKSVMYEKPYIAVLYSSGKIEIHNTFTFENTLEQTIELPEKTKKLRKMVWLTSPRVLTSTTRFGSKKDDVLLKMLGLEEESRLPCMALVYNNESVDLILKKPSIAKIYDILAQEDIEIAIKKVEDMLDKKAYDEPEYGTFVETHLRQIYKYAGLVCMKKLLYEEALTNFRKGGVDPILLIKLFAEVRNGMDLEKGIESVAREFTEMDEGKYNKLLQEMKNGSYLIPKVNVRKETISNETNEQGFISLLSRYLKFCRRTIIKNSHEVEKLEIVDNVLSILYIDQKEVDKLKKLITEFSHINSEFVAQYLYKTHRMYFLASWVYKEFGEPEEVLKIWNQLLIGELNDEEFKLTHKEYLEYLKSVSNELLMVDCLYKLLTDKTLELAVQIFELLSSDTISSLDINHILQKIESLTNASTNDNSATNSYLTSFLERWLSSTKNRNSDIYKHYTKLLMVYIDEVYFWFYSTTEQISDNREYDYDGDNSNRLVGNSRLIKLENEFLSHKSTNGLVPLRLFLHKSLKAQEANRTDEDFYYSLKLVNKLLDSSLSFLRSIQTDNKNHEDSAGDEDSIVQSVVDYIYNRFGQGSEKSLVVGLELVILYLKRGDVDKALRLLVHDICDYGEAECLLSLNTESNHNLLTLGLPITLKILIPQHTLSSLMLLTDSANEKKLLTLITLYSTHPTDLDTCYTLIARLLNRFCDCISLSSVVQHLPNDFLLSSLYLPYFLNSFESQTSKLAVTDIQLSLIHCMDTEKTHIAEQSPSEYGSKCGNSLNRQNFVVLEKSTRCTICKLPMIDANISNEDGFAYNPLTSTVYHMHCI